MMILIRTRSKDTNAVNSMRRVAQAFDCAGITNRMGASVAFFAKGGKGKCLRMWVNSLATEQTLCAGIIAAHPCKKRKDGAPSVEMLQIEMVKDGPPANAKMGHPPTFGQQRQEDAILTAAQYRQVLCGFIRKKTWSVGLRCRMPRPFFSTTS